MGSLPDVNVLLAILHAEHPHANLANKWLDEQRATGGIAVCRVTQMGLLRLLTRKVVMGERVLSAPKAWGYWNDLLSDSRFAFIEEPPGLEREWLTLSAALPSGASVNTDTYLAAFAQAGGLTLVTFDKGFARFPGLSVEILRVD